MGEVYPTPDLAARPTSRALIPDLPVDLRCTLGLQSLEILSERFIDDLGVGETVEIGLPPDRLNPALFDVVGDALGLAARCPFRKSRASPFGVDNV